MNRVKFVMQARKPVIEVLDQYWFLHETGNHLLGGVSVRILSLAPDPKLSGSRRLKNCVVQQRGTAVQFDQGYVERVKIRLIPPLMLIILSSVQKDEIKGRGAASEDVFRRWGATNGGVLGSFTCSSVMSAAALLPAAVVLVWRDAACVALQDEVTRQLLRMYSGQEVKELYS